MGRGTPVHDVCKLSHQGRTLLLLISQTIDGLNLRDCLSKFAIPSLDYSLHFFMAVLTNPEDGASRNFIGSNDRSLTSIDNDHAFADQDVVGSVTGATAVVKTILYCLPQLDQPVDSLAKEIFCQLDFFEILRLWLDDLKAYNKRIFELFSPSEINDWYNLKGVFLPIYLKPGLIAKLYQKFFRIKSYLHERPSATHFELLELVQPNLAAIYRRARTTAKGPKAIFSAVSKKSYVFVKNEEMSQTTNLQMIELATGQKAPGSLSIKSSSIQDNFEQPLSEEAQKQQWNARLEDPNESLNSAQRERSYLHLTKTRLTSIRLQVEKGNLDEFSDLKEEMFFEKVINHIDFTKLSIEIQEKVLKKLPKKSFRKLCLRGCSALTDDRLVPILKNSPHLYHLDLSGTGITQAESIFASCQKLQVLKLNNCIRLRIFAPAGLSIFNRDLPQLRMLDLSNCPLLERLKVPRALEELQLNHSNFPQIVAKQCPLRMLYLNDSFITDQQLQDLPSVFPQLKYLSLQNCSNVTLSIDKITSLFAIYLRTLTGHIYEVCSLTVLADGTLVSMSVEDLIKLWNPLTGRCLHTFENPIRDRPLFAMTDGTIISMGYDETIKLWNPLTGECYRTLKGDSQIRVLTVLPDGTFVIGCYDGAIKLLNPSTGECFRWWVGHSGFVNVLTVLPNGTIVSGGFDQTIKLWNPSTGECIWSLTGHSSNILALAVLIDGTIVSAAADYDVKLWNPSTGECLCTLKQYRTLPQTTLRDGTVVCSSGKDIRLWNICRVAGLK